MTSEGEKNQQSEVTELKKLAVINLVYRANDLYDKYIPQVVQKLESVGHKVMVKEFPRGTDPKEIKKWGEGQPELLKDSIVVTDFTSNDVVTEHSGQLDHKQSYLDRLFESVGARVIIGDDYKEKIGNRRQDGQNEFMGEIIKNIFTRIKEKIQRVFIIRNSILDHGFNEIELIEDELMQLGISKADIQWYKENFIYGDKSMYSPDFSPEEKERAWVIDERMSKLRLEDISYEKAASMMKNWLTDVGIEKDMVLIGNAYESRDFDQPGNCIIVDRHVRLPKPERAYKLALPILDLIQDACEQGLLEFDVKELEQAISRKVEADFGDTER